MSTQEPTSKAVVAALRHALETQTNERELHARIDATLQNLRRDYVQDPAAFRLDDIAFLKSMKGVQAALGDLIATLDEVSDVRTQDDAESLATRLRDIEGRLSPHRVAGRAAKERRELTAVARPSKRIVAAEARLRQAVSRLESSLERCPKCASRLVLREGKNGFFVGCSTYPTCRALRRLSARERHQLYVQE